MGAIIAHELPGEAADFSILIDSGFSVGAALGTNAVSAAFAVLGAILICGLNENFDQKANVYVVSFGAGVLSA
eukprot:gene4299-3102_t